MKQIIKILIVIIFLSIPSKSFSNINNSVIISVGNLPITYVDLIKEMKLISLLTKNTIDSSNKEQIKAIAVQSIIKRKIKEIEVKKFNIENYNKKDLETMILKASQNIGTNPEGLEKLINTNKLSFELLKKRFMIDLKWNSLIFQLYKNKIVLNTSEVEDKINSEIDKTKSQRIFLLSEIEVNKSNDNIDKVLNEIFDNIKKEGFEETAKKFSISKSAEYGGNIGWINKEKLSKKIFSNIENLKIDDISKPIIFDNSIVIIKKLGEKSDKDIEKIKNRIIRQEKEKNYKCFLMHILQILKELYKLISYEKIIAIVAGDPDSINSEIIAKTWKNKNSLKI